MKPEEHQSNNLWTLFSQPLSVCTPPLFFLPPFLTKNASTMVKWQSPFLLYERYWVQLPNEIEHRMVFLVSFLFPFFIPFT